MLKARAISYRFSRNFACSSAIPYYANKKIYSKFERMELTQIFILLFSSIFSIFEQIMQNFVRINFFEEAIDPRFQ